MWYRNCSHENQPPLVLKVGRSSPTLGYNPASDTKDPQNFPRFQFVKNSSSNSYDLLIMNITDSDEGIYYCGTEEKKVEKVDYKRLYSNLTTRVLISKYAALTLFL